MLFLLCAARTYARASVDCVLLLTLPLVLFDVVVVNCLTLLSCTLHNAPLITAEWESRRVRKREMMRRRERAHTSERSCCWFSLMGFYLFRKYDASLYEGCVVPPPPRRDPTALWLHLTICAAHGNFYNCFALTSAL